MNSSTKARFLLIGLLLFMLAGLIGAELYAFPQSLVESQGEATVHIASDRSWRLFADRCFTLNWNINYVNAVYINAEGTVGSHEESFCGINQVLLRVDFSDGSSKDYLFSAIPFFATGAGWAVLIAISLLLYAIFYLFKLMPSPQTALHDLRASFREGRDSLLQFFRTENRLHLALLFGILLSAIGLRLLYLGAPMRYDESSSFLDYVRVDNIFDSLSRYDRPNNHLLNTLLMYLSVKTFGSSDEWALRLPNFLAGLLTVLLTYIAGRQQGNKNVALLAAGFVAVSTALISYSVMARGYMLLVACFMGMFVLAQVIAKRRSPSAWIAFVIASVMGFYSVITMLYAFAGLVLWLLLIMRERKNCFREWGLGMFWAGWMSFLLYVPVLSRYGFRAVISNPYTEQLSWEEFFAQLPQVMRNFELVWLAGIPSIVVIILAIGLLLGLVLAIRNKTVLALYLILPCAIGIILLQRPALYAAPRIFFFSIPLFAMLVSAGLVWGFEKIKANELGILSLVTTMLVSIVLSRAPYMSLEGGVYHDAEDVAAYLATVENDNYRLAFSPNYDAAINYYFLRYGIPLERDSRDYETVDNIYFIVRDTFDKSVGAVRRELIGRESAQFTEPQLVASFELSDLYRMDRRQD